MGKVKPHTRFDPRLNKRVNVSGYERREKYRQYMKKTVAKSPLAKGLTAENLGYIQYKILELIKLNAHYDQETTMDDLYDELAFSLENEKTIKNMVKNLKMLGLLERNGLSPTTEGNRVFWEFYKEYDDGDHLDHLKDNPDPVITIEEFIEKEAKQIDKQLKENIEFKKKQNKRG